MDISYWSQWLYDSIARLAALIVGGEAGLGQIALDFRGDTTDESVCRSIGCGCELIAIDQILEGPVLPTICA